MDQALCAAAGFWDSGPGWVVLPWWIVGYASGSPGESAAEEEQEAELGETEEALMLLAGRRRGQTERGGGVDPRRLSQEHAAAGV